MEAKIEKISELSKLLSVKTRMSDDLFHPFDKFGIGHLLSRLSLEKTWRGLGFASNLLTCPLVDSSTYHVTLSFIYPVYKQLVHLSTRWLVHLPCYSVFYLPCLQATGLLVHSLTCPLTMLPIEVSKSHDKDKNWNVDPQNLFLTKRLSKFALGTWLCQS